MKYLLFFSLFLFFKSYGQETKKTRLYIIGTVHESSPILNPQMLFEILDHIKPDILLQENDSEQISSYFKDISPKSNEQNASLMYLKKYPETLNLPFEFEGRNQYRRNNGMVPTDNLTINLIDSLYKKNLLSPANTKIFESIKKPIKRWLIFQKKVFKL